MIDEKTKRLVEDAKREFDDDPLTKSDLERIKNIQHSAFMSVVGDVLIDKGIITEEELKARMDKKAKHFLECLDFAEDLDSGI